MDSPNILNIDARGSTFTTIAHQYNQVYAPDSFEREFKFHPRVLCSK